MHKEHLNKIIQSYYIYVDIVVVWLLLHYEW